MRCSSTLPLLPSLHLSSLSYCEYILSAPINTDIENFRELSENPKATEEKYREKLAGVLEERAKIGREWDAALKEESDERVRSIRRVSLAVLHSAIDVLAEPMRRRDEEVKTDDDE